MTATAAAPLARTDPAQAGGLESFLDTLPVKLYRTRLASPYDTEFLTGEAGTVVGYPAGDFVGHDPKRRWHELIHPADQERVAAAWLGAPADGSVIEVEYRVRRADGSDAWILSRARKLPGPDGAPYLHGAAIDVTARHEAAELQRQLDAESARRAEIEASRARIIEAADVARRQLERDLHDGAQQQLVLASMTLTRAASRACGTPAEPLVNEAADEVRDALAELRELARGIHPATLTERGLKPALEALAARSPVPVELHVPERRLPPGVEATLYFTAAEALTNVAKYGHATHATVRVEQRGHAVVAEIADDGVGGADPEAGTGLRGLADRVAAAGGTLKTHSPRGGGTRLRAHIPVRS